jgi:hypothetical protein
MFAQLLRPVYHRLSSRTDNADRAHACRDLRAIGNPVSVPSTWLTTGRKAPQIRGRQRCPNDPKVRSKSRASALGFLGKASTNRPVPGRHRNQHITKAG